MFRGSKLPPPQVVALEPLRLEGMLLLCIMNQISFLVHMARLHIQLQHDYLLLLFAQLTHLLLSVFAYLIFENPIAIFRTKHNMVLALIQRM